MTETRSVEEALYEFSRKKLGEVKVLMIEDDTFLSELVLTKLSTHGCIPYSTPSGEEGLQLAAQYNPDIIILDLMLPGISGEEVLVKLKSDTTLKHIPVIVFSNKSEDEDIKKNLSNGATEYLVKSRTDLADLPIILAKALGKA
jgi:DNA-binding response OmpR family regulator